MGLEARRDYVPEPDQARDPLAEFEQEPNSKVVVHDKVSTELPIGEFGQEPTEGLQQTPEAPAQTEPEPEPWRVEMARAYEAVNQQKKILRSKLLISRAEVDHLSKEDVGKLIELADRAKNALTPNEIFNATRGSKWRGNLRAFVALRDPENKTNSSADSAVTVDETLLDAELEAMGAGPEVFKKSLKERVDLAHENAMTVAVGAREALPPWEWTEAMKSSDPVFRMMYLVENRKLGLQRLRNLYGLVKNRDNSSTGEIIQAVSERKAQIKKSRDEGHIKISDDQIEILIDRSDASYLLKKLAKGDDITVDLGSEPNPANVNVEAEPVVAVDKGETKARPSIKLVHKREDEGELKRQISERAQEGPKLEATEAELFATITAELQAKYNVGIVGAGSSAEQLKLARMLLDAMLDAPQAHARWYKAADKNRLRTDGVVEINPDAPVAEVIEFLLNLTEKNTPQPEQVQVVDGEVVEDRAIAVRPKELILGLSTRLTAARTEYFKLQTQLDQSKKKWFGLGHSQEKEELQAQVAEAEAKYKELRAEHVGESVTRALDEGLAAADTKLAEYQLRERNQSEKISELFGKKLERYKALPKSVKVGVNLALLGISLAAPTGAVTIGALWLRRGLGGLGTGASTHELMKLGSAWIDKKHAESVLRQGSLEEIQTTIAEYRVRAALDGKTKDLESDELYQNLLSTYELAYQEQFRQEHQTASAEQRLRTLSAMLDRENDVFNTKFKDVRRKRAGMKAAAATFGVVVAGGGLSNLLSKFSGHENAAATSPATGTFAPESGVPGESMTTPSPVDAAPETEPTLVTTEVTHNGHDTGAFIESMGDTSVVHIGDRGIEGTLLDLKDSSPERYNQMMSWLHERYPNSSAADSGLVHKFISEQVTNGEDLNRIGSGELVIKADGTIQFDTDKFEFLRPTPSLDLGHGDSLVSEQTIDRVEIPNEPEIIPITDETPVSGDGLDSSAAYDSSVAENADVKHMPTTLEEAREYAAFKTDKTSTGLQLVLGEKYDRFIDKEVKVSARSLNKIRHLTFAEFQNSSKLSDHFGKTYKGLVKFLEGKEIKPNTKIHEAMIELAKQWKQKH